MARARRLYRPVGSKEFELIRASGSVRGADRARLEHDGRRIPAEDLDELNQNIVGTIEVIAEFDGT
jgi:hypothetical protein